MSITGSLKSAGSMAGSAMVAGIQRVGEKVRALSGSTNPAKFASEQHHHQHHQRHSVYGGGGGGPAGGGGGGGIMSQSLMLPTTDDHGPSIMTHSAENNQFMQQVN